jgi:hypothetical protein
MRSLRTRLLALWLMLAVSAAAIGFVLFEFYRQSANSEVMRAEDAVARSCRDIGEQLCIRNGRLERLHEQYRRYTEAKTR